MGHAHDSHVLNSCYTIRAKSQCMDGFAARLALLRHRRAHLSANSLAVTRLRLSASLPLPSPPLPLL
eukprot:10588679-Prorocentrum_lima.AAC.1